MKIEKVNENQIRCSLSHEDLEERQIKLSELAYGSEKAKNLFHEMVAEANEQFGFNVDDIPLMVEAIPSAADSLVLLISKVEYPDELDPRFSRFSDPGEEYFDQYDEEEEDIPSKKGAADIMELFRSMKDGETDSAGQRNDEINEKKKEADETDVPDEKDETAEEECAGENNENRGDKKQETASENHGARRTEKQDPDTDIICVYEFKEMEQAEELAGVLKEIYHGENSLYKDMQENRYFLLMHKKPHSPKEFNKICNMAAEFGAERKFVPSMSAYFEEHSSLILAKKAIQTLAML